MSVINDGIKQIWMDDITCSRTETHIEQCTHADSGKWQWGTLTNCTHANDIGLGCDDKTSSTETNAYPGIRLVNNSSVITLSLGIFKLEGRVEVRKNGMWGTICNSNTDVQQ